MDCILKYFPNLTQKQQNQFELLFDLYSIWNQRINVISRKDIEHLYEHHILHSLAIAAFYQFKANTNVVDIGTGGGFPGVPLAILFPEVNFTLVDSIAKKLTVVNEVAKAAGIINITTLNNRAEQIKNQFDFVVSRAVTEFPQFYKWTRSLVSQNQHNNFKNGIIYLKGGDLSNELNGFKNIKIHDIATVFSESFFLTKKVVYMPF